MKIWFKGRLEGVANFASYDPANHYKLSCRKSGGLILSTIINTMKSTLEIHYLRGSENTRASTGAESLGPSMM
jgi:hypothetical protein